MQDIGIIFEFFVNAFHRIIRLLDSIVFSVGGFDVSFWSIIFSFLVLSIITFAFWKGAKAK